MTNERTIVVQQLLRTTALAALLGVIGLAFVAISLAIVAGTGSLSATFYVVEAVVLVILGGAVGLFLRVIVRVVDTPAGRSLEVLYGPGGLVRQVFTPAEILSAHADSFSFVQMGGWGYRGSLRLFHRAALATRRGEALDLRLSGNRRFIVTVDHAQDFVTALRVSSS